MVSKAKKEPAKKAGKRVRSVVHGLVYHDLTSEHIVLVAVLR